MDRERRQKEHRNDRKQNPAKCNENSFLFYSRNQMPYLFYLSYTEINI